jgi:hypothetical protein
MLEPDAVAFRTVIGKVLDPLVGYVCTRTVPLLYKVALRRFASSVAIVTR